MSDNTRNELAMERTLAQIDARLATSEQRLSSIEKRFFIEMDKISSQLENLRVGVAQRRGTTLAIQWLFATAVGAAGWLSFLFDFFRAHSGH